MAATSKEVRRSERLRQSQGALRETSDDISTTIKHFEGEAGKKGTRKRKLTTAVKDKVAKRTCTTSHEEINDSSSDKIYEPSTEKSVTDTGIRIKKKPKLLNKDERSKVVKSVKDVTSSDTLKQVQECFKEEMNSRDLGLSQIINDFLTETSLLNHLVEHHRTMFLDLYKKCSKGKEKYLQLELEWYSHCSVLLPKDVSVQKVLPDVKDDEAISVVRNL